MCLELHQMIDENKAPAGALRPRSLPKEGLYSLDIDSPIWDDCGLNDHDAAAVPRWMGDNGIRQAIPAQLTIGRCNEELARLKKECNHLRVWAKSERERLAQAYETTGR